MPTTSRMGWSFPTENDRDWWELFVALMNSMDADVWAATENTYMVLSGGGDLDFEPITDTFSWSADLYVVSTLYGSKARIPAGSVTLEDGDIAYIEITRPMAGNFDATLQVTSQPLSGNANRNKVFVALRNGSTVITRQFGVVVTGTPS